uniref:Putative N-acetylmuramoyl-L-alanine amidase n=2 Tax=viral metagenome TaxID=1070528 RepID=A0A6M3M062_9ZZZZ
MPVPFVDMRAELVALAGGDFVRRELTSECAIVLHYWGCPPLEQGVHEAAMATFHHHFVNNGWPNIGYHYHVSWPDGAVAYVGDVFTARANVSGLNHLAIGICVEGDLKGDIPDAVIEGVRCAIGSIHAEVVRRMGDKGQFVYGLPIYGHKEFALPGHGTVCPGPGGMRIVEALRVC